MLKIKDERDAKILAAFLDTFSHSKFKKGVLIRPDHLIGLANTDKELETHDRHNTVDKDLVSDALKVLDKTNVHALKFLHYENQPLRIIPEGSDLQFLIAPYKDEEK
jgi:hypothetical protein